MEQQHTLQNVNLQLVLKELHIPEEIVLNVYQFGSHMDAKLKTVIGTLELLLLKRPEHLDDVCSYLNACLYTESQWTQLLKQHDMLTLVCMFLPSQHVWLHKKHFNFHLSLAKIKKGAAKETHKCWDKAKKLFKEGDVNKCKKNIVHGIRYLLLGIQLAEELKLHDYKAANEYTAEIQTLHFSNWQQIEHKYRPVYQQLADKLKLIVDSKILLQLQATPTQTPSTKTPSTKTPSTQPCDRNSLHVLEYLQKHSLSSLTEFFAIDIQAIEFSDELQGVQRVYQLLYDTEDSPLHSLIVQECNGIVVYAAAEGWQVLSYGLPVTFEHDHELAPALQWDPLTTNITQLHHGTLFTLVMHQNQWIVFSVPHSKQNIESFWSEWNAHGYALHRVTCHMCYSFMMTEGKEIVLIAVRDMHSFNEVDAAAVAKESDWFSATDVKDTLGVQSVSSVVELANTLHPPLHKGYLLTDTHFTRVKCTSVQYRALQELSVTPVIPRTENNNNYEQHTLQALLQLVRWNVHTDIEWFSAMCPQWREHYDKLHKEYVEFTADVQQRFDNLKHITDNAQFAIQVKTHRKFFAQVFFGMRKESTDTHMDITVFEYFKHIKLDSLCNLFLSYQRMLSKDALKHK